MNDPVLFSPNIYVFDATGSNAKILNVVGCSSLIQDQQTIVWPESRKFHPHLYKKQEKRHALIRALRKKNKLLDFWFIRWISY